MLPKDWDVAPLWAVTTCNDEVLTEGTDPEWEMAYVEISGVTAGVGIVEATELRFAEAPSRARRRVRTGDVLVSTVRTYLRAIAPVVDPPENLVASSGFAVLRPRAIAPSFLGYAVQAEFFIAKVIARSVGVSYPAINPGDLVKIKVPCPPLPQQAAIAAFLDRETAKIDALVEEQKRLIDLLKEKRQAVISHAVTKGLNPGAPMKDTGIEWLGQVPEHWEVVPCGYRYEVQLGQMLNEERAQGEHLRPYLRVFDVQWGRINIDDLPTMNFPPSAQQRYRLAAGDLLVNEGGSYVGRSAIWRGQVEECYYQKALHRVRPRNRHRDTSEYLLWVMELATKLGVFVAGGNQTTIDHLTAEQLRSRRFPFPSPPEQTAIAEFLVRETIKLEQLERNAELSIGLLLERRSALISAAVTGKIDVRDPATAARANTETLVAAEIVGRLAHMRTFGRVKFQKAIYLAETHANVNELRGKYLRAAAGPLDRELVDRLETELVRTGKVEVEQPDGAGGGVTYRTRDGCRFASEALTAALGDRKSKLDHIITVFADLDTKATEAVATLYAVWNDFLLDGKDPTDSDITSGVLDHWHPEKREKFRVEELNIRLGWMRRNGLVPSGTGPRTHTGRLFP